MKYIPICEIVITPISLKKGHIAWKKKQEALTWWKIRYSIPNFINICFFHLFCFTIYVLMNICVCHLCSSRSRSWWQWSWFTSFLRTILLWTAVAQHLLIAYSLKSCSMLDMPSLDNLQLKSSSEEFNHVVSSFLVRTALSQ